MPAAFRQRRVTAAGASVDGPVQVLLVDDDEADIALIMDAFESYDASVEIHVAGDGIDALAYLQAPNVDGSQPRPDLILLDLNMPRMDGRETLGLLKADANLTSIPVVVFTTSEQPDDIEGSYGRHANAYVTKPIDYNEFTGAVEKIHDFYGKLATRLR